ncbi:MAG: GlcNAc-PI de-N-acetylase [Bacteroidetes bacterium GWF2_41_31]|nr:MAG: GlcNAc-PI de-N-acetylase [Bacteroidetes bacterium GWF2_41_31]
MQRNILIIAPHADDEVLGCGGIISKYSNEGFEVHILVATNASIGAPELFNQEGIDNVRNEAIAAHKILNVKQTHFLELPAPRLDVYPNYQIAIAFSEIINEIRPEALFIPHRGDIHKDHEAVFNAALVAARPINNCSVKKIYAYETLSETEWAAPFGDDNFIPNRFVNITKEFKLKLEAMECFKSQLKPFPNPRSLEAIEALAKYRGATVGFERAEAFMVIRETED